MRIWVRVAAVLLLPVVSVVLQASDPARVEVPSDVRYSPHGTGTHQAPPSWTRTR